MSKPNLRKARNIAEQLSGACLDSDVQNLANAYLYTLEQLDEFKNIKIRNSQAVMDLFFALRAIKGKPTLRDLVRLAKRMK